MIVILSMMKSTLYCGHQPESRFMIQTPEMHIRTSQKTIEMFFFFCMPVSASNIRPPANDCTKIYAFLLGFLKKSVYISSTYDMRDQWR